MFLQFSCYQNPETPLSNEDVSFTFIVAAVSAIKPSVSQSQTEQYVKKLLGKQKKVSLIIKDFQRAIM